MRGLDHTTPAPRAHPAALAYVNEGGGRACWWWRSGVTGWHCSLRARAPPHPHPTHPHPHPRPTNPPSPLSSCWAFATTAAVEGAHAVATNGKGLLSLSEEQIVSCDKADGNDGCNGGDQLPALQWLAKQPAGQCSEASYPYTSGGGATGKCKTACTGVVKITSGVEVQKHNETALQVAIANSPLSLSVDASNDAVWQSYSGGIVTEKCSTCKDASCLDHGVTGVGYGTDAAGVDYWIVKNSWSASVRGGLCVCVHVCVCVCVCVCGRVALRVRPAVASRAARRRRGFSLRHHLATSRPPMRCLSPPPRHPPVRQWGENGYIRLGRGTAFNPYGQCGVQIDNQYATV